jgi:hypothetical protein
LYRDCLIWTFNIKSVKIEITRWIADKRSNANLILAVNENKEKLIDIGTV